jgi:NAD(P)-dependent dehydrogenase (short-subunit alcohol dehydrogenase family)
MNDFQRISFTFGGFTDLGRAYHQAFANLPDTYSIAFSRSLNNLDLRDIQPSLFGNGPDACNSITAGNELFVDAGVNGSKASAVFKAGLQNLSLNPQAAREVVFVYAIGPFKFENPQDREYKQIDFSNADREVLRTNFRLAQNLALRCYRAIAEHVKETQQDIHLKLVGFGSVSDQYGSPMWPSFLIAKAALERFFERLTTADSKNGVLVSSCMVKTATIATSAENRLRPRAPEEEKALWLTPQAVVDRSIVDILQLQPGQRESLRVHNNWPGFDREIYSGNQIALERWLRQMGQGIEQPQSPATAPVRKQDPQP